MKIRIFMHEKYLLLYILFREEKNLNKFSKKLKEKVDIKMRKVLL